MSGGLSSPFSLVNESDVRGKSGEQLMEQMEKILLDAAYSYELLKRDVERIRNLLNTVKNTADGAAQASDLATVATSGSYNDLADAPTLATVAASGLHSDLTLDDGTNPHGTTKSDVGLANVSNDAQLKIASNLSDLNNAATARNNLGLGMLATLSSVNNGNWSGTDLSIANGGTGQSTALAAMTALAFNVTYRNIAINSDGIPSAAGAEYNIVIGWGAGKALTTGDDNIAVGKSTLVNLTEGIRNVAIGVTAGYSLDEGIDNTMVGHSAGYSIEGDKNTFVGTFSGRWTTTGSRNTCIGYGASPEDGFSDAIAIGAFVKANGSGHIAIGGNTDSTYDIVIGDYANSTRCLIGADLTVKGADYLIRTFSSLYNHAGTSTGTLTNAPSAGNPSKWIAINDNGITRYIPAWT